MNWRLILFSACLIVPSCGGGSATKPDNLPASTDVIKVTYLRFSYNQQTKKLTPLYYVMLSSSWDDKYGEDPKEPLARLFPRKGNRPPILGIVRDFEMKQLVRKMESKGIGRLASVRPEDLDLSAIANIERIPMGLDPQQHEAYFTRIITVGGDGWHKSYLYKDAHATGDKAVVQTFVDVETEVIRLAAMSTVQTSTEPMPLHDK